MPLDWRIQYVMDARNLLHDVRRAVSDASPADKALKAAALAAEVAWEALEQQPERYQEPAA